jgi:hypothetical protein
MKVYGIDFTSSPSSRKPITCLECALVGSSLSVGTLMRWPNFEGYEAMLRQPGPWIAGMDFPFGQARRFIDTAGWPESWHGYVSHAASLGRVGFVDALNDYRVGRAVGDKEHRRETDKRAGSISPQKLYGVPVAKMFFEGAPRLIAAGVTVPELQQGDPQRIAVEAYPGVLARYIIGRKSYKNDTKKKQTAALRDARLQILQGLSGGALKAAYGLEVAAPLHLAEDPSGDSLDALLCAVQAAWSWTQRASNYGAPEGSDALEGWIADPLSKKQEPLQ